MEVFNAVITPLLIVLDVVVKMATVMRDVAYVGVGTSVVLVLFAFAVITIRQRRRRIAKT